MEYIIITTRKHNWQHSKIDYGRLNTDAVNENAHVVLAIYKNTMELPRQFQTTKEDCTQRCDSARRPRTVTTINNNVMVYQTKSE